MRRKIVFGLILSAFVVLVIMAGCGSDSQADIEAAVSDDLQAASQTSLATDGYGSDVAFKATNVRERFVLTDVNGNIRKWSEFAGKPVVVNFWATWCGPCRAEIPTMKKLYAEYKDRGLEIISISVDSPKTIKNVAGFAQKMQMPWVVVYADQSSAEEFQLGRGIPMTVFYDANGNETGRFTGAQPESKFRQEFDKMF